MTSAGRTDNHWACQVCPKHENGLHMAKRGTDHWSETYCDKRFHPKFPTGDAYWFFCRLEKGHFGDCDCEGAHEMFNELGGHNDD